MSIEHTILRIRRYATEQQWSRTRLAREAGLPHNTLKAFDLQTWNPTADTLRKLESIIPADFQAVELSEPEAA